MSHKPKSNKDFQRRLPFRQPHKHILIVCEGAKTEPNYFEAFRKKLHLSSAEIEITGRCGSAPINVVNYAITLMEKAENSPIKNSYDTVWCVMDVESGVDRHKTLTQAQNKAKSSKIKTALSNPCFEYWLLLHFKKNNKQMNTPQAKEELNKVFKKYYPQRKEDSLTFEELHPRIGTAIANSRNIIKKKRYGNDISSDQCNPGTYVHLVVEEILDIADRQ